MKITIKKWGNSLGIRIPKPFADEMGIDENSIVEMDVVGGVIVIKPVKKGRTLKELMDDVTEENTHRQILDDSKGNESW